MSLIDTVDKHNKLTFEAIAEIAKQLGTRLRDMHNKGVIHRDLKLENIMASFKNDEVEKVTIIDFGFAGLEKTKTKSLVGTPEYIHPYVYESRYRKTPYEIGRHLDMYAAGIVILEVLCGAVNVYNRFPWNKRFVYTTDTKRIIYESSYLESFMTNHCSQHQSDSGNQAIKLKNIIKKMILIEHHTPEMNWDVIYSDLETFTASSKLPE